MPYYAPNKIAYPPLPARPSPLVIKSSFRCFAFLFFFPPLAPPLFLPDFGSVLRERYGVFSSRRKLGQGDGARLAGGVSRPTLFDSFPFAAVPPPVGGSTRSILEISDTRTYALSLEIKTWIIWSQILRSSKKEKQIVVYTTRRSVRSTLNSDTRRSRGLFSQLPPEVVRERLVGDAKYVSQRRKSEITRVFRNTDIIFDKRPRYDTRARPNPRSLFRSIGIHGWNDGWLTVAEGIASRKA